ncbi:MAG: UbiX family flavin prenyltransferase [Bacteroidetes bacterium]|nr:UbiX family flavin prenyltransferase [Bacteroidota bacterium]
MQNAKIAVGITGASGSIYARQLLQHLKSTAAEVHVVWSSNAKTVWQQELGPEAAVEVPFKTWAPDDFFAPFASGSAGFDALILCPCSMGTLGRIASGSSNDLITRAADVMLKERKKLICVVRETPFNLVHLRNMTTVTEAGGIICPASPSFYSKPQNFSELADTVIHRVLQLAGLEWRGFRWGG